MQALNAACRPAGLPERPPAGVLRRGPAAVMITATIGFT
jgi:hypothetical protein